MNSDPVKHLFVVVLLSLKNGKVTGKIRYPERTATVPQVQLGTLFLSPNDMVVIGAQQRSLEQLVGTIAQYDPRNPSSGLEDQGQLALGEYLAKQLFGKLNRERSAELQYAESVRLIIQTDDYFLCRLPWALLVWRGQFAVNGRWTIAVSVQTDFEKKIIQFSQTPQVLVIAPNPFPDDEPTDAKEHVEELVKRLSEGDTRFVEGDLVRVVKTTEQLKECVSRHVPEAVYFYGHGKKTSTGALRLVFETNQGAAEGIDVIEFTNLLSSGPLRPKLVYVNCCHGDDGGATGIGRQLGPSFDAVLTQRTMVNQLPARNQAVEFWFDVLRRFRNPEASSRNLYRAAGNFQRPDWFSVSLYVGYGSWESKVVERIDPQWENLMDRTKNFGVVQEAINVMLEHPRLRGTALVLVGDDQSGLNHFHLRLQTELPIRFKGRSDFVSKPLTWPDQFPTGGGTDGIFRKMFLDALGIGHLRDLPAHLRHTAGSSGRVAVYFRHLPLRSSQQLPVSYLKAYLEFWEREVLKNLDSNQRGILAISYQVPQQEVISFRNDVAVTHRIEREFNQSMECHVLDPLDLVPEDDLARFCARHEFGIPHGAQSVRIISAIMKSTGGHYTRIVAILKKLLTEGPPWSWDQWIQGLPPAE